MGFLYGTGVTQRFALTGGVADVDATGSLAGGLKDSSSVSLRVIKGLRYGFGGGLKLSSSVSLKSMIKDDD